MKIPAIKKLVESYSDRQLAAAEEALLEEQKPEIEIEGDDEGEQLTHTLAARWILEKMKNEGAEFNFALREYTKRVRTSIS
jgi:hypothetical protein